MRLLSHHSLILSRAATFYQYLPRCSRFPNAPSWILFHISTCSPPPHLEQDEKLLLLLVIRLVRYLVSIHDFVH
jgi:hypothetical protein